MSIESWGLPERRTRWNDVRLPKRILPLRTIDAKNDNSSSNDQLWCRSHCKSSCGTSRAPCPTRSYQWLRYEKQSADAHRPYSKRDVPNIYDVHVIHERHYVRVAEEKLGQAAILLDCMISEILVNACEQERGGADHECCRCRKQAHELTKSSCFVCLRL